jgi:hypothetical protein
METHFQLARMVAELPAESIKDLYWRTWKMKVLIALDTIVGSIQTLVTHMGLTVQVCHSSNKRGATIFLESSRPGRKWDPQLNHPIYRLMPLRTADSVMEAHPVTWPSDEISPAKAHRLQQIILGGLPSVIRVHNQRTREVPHARKTVKVTATCVPLCSLHIFELMYDPLAYTLPTIDDPGAVFYRMVKHPYETTYRSMAAH